MEWEWRERESCGELGRWEGGGAAGRCQALLEECKRWNSTADEQGGVYLVELYRVVDE